MAFLSMGFVLGCPRLVTCLPWLCRDLPCRGGDGTRYDGDPKWQLGVLNGAKPTRDLAGCGTLFWVCRPAPSNCSCQLRTPLPCCTLSGDEHCRPLSRSLHVSKRHSLAVLTDLEGRMFTFQTTNDSKVYT
jgi:hypothetical protein